MQWILSQASISIFTSVALGILLSMAYNFPLTPTNLGTGIGMSSRRHIFTPDQKDGQTSETPGELAQIAAPSGKHSMCQIMPINLLVPAALVPATDTHSSMSSNKSTGCGHNPLVGVPLSSMMFVPIQPAVTCATEEASRVLSNVKRKPSKYNPPNFISTVRYMHKKLYKVAGTSMFTTEPSEEKGILAFWKAQLLKEHWFTNENVSALLISC